MRVIFLLFIFFVIASASRHGGKERKRARLYEHDSRDTNRYNHKYMNRDSDDNSYEDTVDDSEKYLDDNSAQDYGDDSGASASRHGGKERKRARLYEHDSRDTNRYNHKYMNRDSDDDSYENTVDDSDKYLDDNSAEDYGDDSGASASRHGGKERKRARLYEHDSRDTNRYNHKYMNRYSDDDSYEDTVDDSDKYLDDDSAEDSGDDSGASASRHGGKERKRARLYEHDSRDTNRYNHNYMNRDRDDDSYEDTVDDSDKYLDDDSAEDSDDDAGEDSDDEADEDSNDDWIDGENSVEDNDEDDDRYTQRRQELNRARVPLRFMRCFGPPLRNYYERLRQFP